MKAACNGVRHVLCETRGVGQTAGILIRAPHSNGLVYNAGVLLKIRKYALRKRVKQVVRGMR